MEEEMELRKKMIEMEINLENEEEHEALIN